MNTEERNKMHSELLLKLESAMEDLLTYSRIEREYNEAPYLKWAEESLDEAITHLNSHINEQKNDTM